MNTNPTSPARDSTLLLLAMAGLLCALGLLAVGYQYDRQSKINATVQAQINGLRPGGDVEERLNKLDAEFSYLLIGVKTAVTNINTLDRNIGLVRDQLQEFSVSTVGAVEAMHTNVSVLLKWAALQNPPASPPVDTHVQPDK